MFFSRESDSEGDDTSYLRRLVSALEFRVGRGRLLAQAVARCAPRRAAFPRSGAGLDAPHLGGAAEDASGARTTVTVRVAREQLAANIDTKCSIFQEELEDDDEVRVRPCKHAEHAECLDQWLRVNKCCPICKAEVPAL